MPYSFDKANYPFTCTFYLIDGTNYQFTFVSYPIDGADYPFTFVSYPIDGANYPFTFTSYPFQFAYYPFQFAYYPILKQQTQFLKVEDPDFRGNWVCKRNHEFLKILYLINQFCYCFFRITKIHKCIWIKE